MFDFFTPRIIEVIRMLVFVFVIVSLMSLIDLPDWIAKKLRGSSQKDKINELEKRIKELEEKLNNRESK